MQNTQSVVHPYKLGAAIHTYIMCNDRTLYIVYNKYYYKVAGNAGELFWFVFYNNITSCIM